MPRREPGGRAAHLRHRQVQSGVSTRFPCVRCASRNAGNRRPVDSRGHRPRGRQRRRNPQFIRPSFGLRVTSGEAMSDAKLPESPRLKRKDYEKELAKLHVELVKLQEWVKQQRARVRIVVEVRDVAAKGGTSKAISKRVSPRVFRVVALPAPA